ncbi:50S ribosomal protein L9 [Candidatus Caldipriscus sp.]|nr:50S ribosomal protein L9 [Candidatus Caldipriscus sp.]
MKQVEVLLVKDVPNLGKAGDVVKVRWGYAKNYLILKGFALLATESVLKSYENIKKMKEISLQRKKKRMEKLAGELSKEKLLFVLKVNEEGKPYGSVSSSDIVKKLKEKGYNIDRSMVQIDSISEFGTFQIPIKLHPEVVANLKIVVEPER